MASQSNLRAAYAKHVLYEAMLEKYKMNTPHAGSTLPDKPPKLETSPFDGTWSPGPVCIIGAGAAGLATAIYIHDACVKADVACPTIDIYEATERAGGRVYTYQFTDTANRATHDYYDIGAMRIPDIVTMNSTFEMIDYLVNKGQDIVKKPYIYNDPKKREPLMYYHKVYQPEDVDGKMEQFDGLISLFVKQLNVAKTAEEWSEIFKGMSKTYDVYSTRAYLQLGNAPDAKPDTAPDAEKIPNNWTFEQTQIAETFDTSTGLFDRAWMETICDYADFRAASNSQWWRLEDSHGKYGMQALTNAMTNYLKSLGISINYNSPVTSLVYNQTGISVSVNDATPKDYESVINTTTMGCFGRMNIGGLGLSDDVLTGVRALSYDHATKVAVKFNSDWWTPLLNNQPNRGPPTSTSKFLGGVSSTDLPISNVVYPSWQDSGSTILMVSYAWAQDATRLTSLIPDYAGVTQTKIDHIADLCLRYLAELWVQIPNAPTYSQLRGLYQSHHAFAWANDPNTAGAFAMFGPGQFSHLYPLMQEPQCRGDGSNKVGFYFAGEATSVHHAWISGAFDSAYTTVWQWAGIQDSQKPGVNNAVQQALYDLPVGEGRHQHVAEMDERLLDWTIWASVQEEQGGEGKMHI